MLDNTPLNQSSKFKTKNWVEIIDELQGTYDEDQIRFKSSMLRSSLCECSDAYILFKGTITARNSFNMTMYNLIEYSDHYSKKFGILQPYCRDESAVDAANGNIVDFTVANSIIDLFKI